MIVIAMGEARPEVKIDFVGMLLAAVAIFLINLGFNNVRTWGVLPAGPAAPYNIPGLPPAAIRVGGNGGGVYETFGAAISAPA